VLAALDAVGLRAFVAGGWGVDALIGRQTRVHRDLDLALDLTHATLERALSALKTLDYCVEPTGDRPGWSWLPVRALGRPPSGGLRRSRHRLAGQHRRPAALPLPASCLHRRLDQRVRCQVLVGP